MKALSLKQPWAGLVLDGRKTVETRVWNTKFRGEFYIHSEGAIIGKANLADVISYENDAAFLADSSRHLVTKETLNQLGWAGRKKYGFILKDAKKIDKPRAIRGQLNFFEVKE